MNILLAPIEITSITPITLDDDPDITHLWCCDEKVSLCGRDIADDPWVEDEDIEVICPRCVEAQDTFCVLCGECRDQGF